KPNPTDHRGVVSEFQVTPAPSPLLVSPIHRRVTAGPVPLVVRFHATGSRDEVVAFQRRPGAPLLSVRSTGGRTDAFVRLAKTHLRPGRYDVVLAHHGEVRARAAVWLYARGAQPTLRTDRSTYAVGDPVRVHWTGAPGTQLDW